MDPYDTTPDILTGHSPPLAAPERHFPNRPVYKPRTFARTRNQRIRSTAKRLSQTTNHDLCQGLGLACARHCVAGNKFDVQQYGPVNADAGAQRPYIEEELRWGLYALPPIPPERTRIARVARTHSRWVSDEIEGEELARSPLRLPSDYNRAARRPSLEREDAFRDETTVKARAGANRRCAFPSRPSIRSTGSYLAGMSDDAQVSELYRLGLLYDDEQDRGSGFDLNSISHEAPVYSIRPARRSRKSKPGFGMRDPLMLDLSFTDLGENDAIAQYLSPTLTPESSSSNGESSHNPTEQPPQSFAPLRVIYEVDSSSPSFDVDTSQPPDLISDDFLSDYDYFTESDLDDLPNQREIRDGAAAPSPDDWVMLGDDS